MTSSLALALRGRTVLLHTSARPAFAVGRGTPEIAMNRGNFRIADQLIERAPLPHLTVAGDELRFASAPGENPALVWRIEQGDDEIRLALRHAGPGINRVWLTLPADPAERVRGGGEQFSYLDLRGRRFPLWTSEPGVGRDKATAITRQADREANAGGDYWTTTYPQPTFLSDRLYALHVETTAYAEFDFTAPDRHDIEIWEPPAAIHLLAAPDHASLVRRLSDLFGRAPALPAWAMEGAIIGLKDGENSFARLERILEAGAAVSALWCEDWAGVRETSFGTRLFWDWRWSERRYPRLPERIAALARRRIRFLAYANPYLAVDGALYPEALANNLFARDARGGPYNVDFGEFEAGVVDFTNKDASAWFADRILKREMLDLGIAGWMADFGEYLPTDTHLAHADPLLAHNAWPTLWAEVNARALATHPRGRDALFFMRAGYTGIQRHCPLLWGGDQCVDFSRHDGLRTTITAALSSGLHRQPRPPQRHRRLHQPLRPRPHPGTVTPLDRNGRLHPGDAHARGQPSAPEPANRRRSRCSRGIRPLHAHPCCPGTLPCRHRRGGGIRPASPAPPLPAFPAGSAGRRHRGPIPPRPGPSRRSRSPGRSRPLGSLPAARRGLATSLVRRRLSRRPARGGGGPARPAPGLQSAGESAREAVRPPGGGPCGCGTVRPILSMLNTAAATAQTAARSSAACPPATIP